MDPKVVSPKCKIQHLLRVLGLLETAADRRFLHLPLRITVWREIFVGQNIFLAVFADLPQTAKILTVKFCDRHALCFVIVELRNFFEKSLPAANPQNFCPVKNSRHTVLIIHCDSH